MTIIESTEKIIPHAQETVFSYLGDFRNFDSLMPKERVDNWQATADRCSFRIAGMADITMEYAERKPNSELVITSAGKTPFRFTLHVLLSPAETGSTKGQLVMKADLNPMLKMMAERPLQNFLNMLAERLPTLPIQEKA